MDKVKINAKVEWAFLNSPNEMSGKYQVDLCNLSPKAVDALQGLGITIQYRDDKPGKGSYITCKSSNPIKAYDEAGMPLGTDVSVGNGSGATALVGFYEWTFKSKKGVSPSLNKLVITDLIEYGGNDADDGGDEAL